MKKLLLGIGTIILLAGCMQANKDQPTPSNEITPAEMAAEISSEEQAFTTGDTLYSLIPEESEFFWRGEKVVGGHEGLLFIEAGELEYTNEKIGGNFVMNMDNLIVTDIQGDEAKGLEDHLKNEDFFNTAEFPTAEFSITNSEKIADNKYNLTGDLTIKGITNSITFETQFTPIEDRVLGLADFTIDRTLWDIKYGSGKFFTDLGDRTIKDDIIIKLTLTFIDAAKFYDIDFENIEYNEPTE